MKIKLLFIFGILCLNVKAQEVTTIIPPSPEAAALGKFTEIPVGLHTGVPNINIPLNTISSGKLSLDLSLTYHSTIKVQDEASSVGLGWSLSGIGLISRSVIGLADDLPGGYFSVLNRIDKYINDELTDEEKLDYLKSVNGGLIDSQPDQYFFNIGGYSGKIVLDKAGKPYVIPHQNLKILPGIGPMQTDPINPWWEIITPDGTRYKFDHQAVEQTTPTSQGLVPDPVGSDRFISSWRLSEIISSDHVDTIKFGYFPTITNNFSQYVTKKTLADPRIIPNCSFAERNTFNQTGSLIVGKLVSGIIHRHGKIDFIYSSREDLPGSGKLDSVIVYDHNDQIKMSYVFEYDYFNSSVTSETEPHLCKRLKLLSVREINNGLEKPPYEFIYNEQNQLPPKAALKEGTQEEKNAWMSQDHWGFFNGIQNNSLIPRTVIEYRIGQSAFELVIPGGNRSSGVGPSLTNVIKEIKYPTGGASTFTFEGHEVFERQEQGWVPFQNASVAGGIGELPPLLGPCVYPLDDAGTDYPKFACSDLFEVQEGGESFKMIINHYYGGQFPLQGTSVMSTRILNENGSVVRRYDGENLSFDLIIRLDPGKYRLMAASSVVDAGTSISLRKSGGIIHTNVPKGGARIAKIVDFDGFNPEKKNG